MRIHRSQADYTPALRPCCGFDISPGIHQSCDAMQMTARCRVMNRGPTYRIPRIYNHSVLASGCTHRPHGGSGVAPAASTLCSYDPWEQARAQLECVASEGCSMHGVLVAEYARIVEGDEDRVESKGDVGVVSEGGRQGCLMRMIIIDETGCKNRDDEHRVARISTTSMAAPSPEVDHCGWRG